MIDFNNFYQCIIKHKLVSWLDTVPALLSTWNKQHHTEKFNQWLNSIKHLPTLIPDCIDLKTGITASISTPLTKKKKQQLLHLLQILTPWRKGPYSVYGVHIDAEWRSDWKWQRLIDHIKPLTGKTVLDVGCNNGYHLWRMIGEDANLVIGIDPIPLYLCQFEAIRKLLNNDMRAHLLPLGIEQLPASMAFDTVFSMGVLYHRRSPLDHLIQLKEQLVKGGELILETLVIKGNNMHILTPQDRYASMKNVYFIPSIKAMENWLYRCGFTQVKLVHVGFTCVEEQRKTNWMTSDSLADHLSPNDSKKTIEGYPAPMRAIFIAKKP